ncbi:MAG: hypothetical protein GY765_43625, partial [bacterium]|nr:hypothetical protein [bacterium]
MPSGKTLKVLSFGYDNVMADMLFIWSIQLYGTPNLTNRYDFLEQIYDTITDISPQYTEAYIVGSWIMALELGDIDMAVRLLEKGSRNMQDSWLFPYECGYYLSKYKKDFKGAEKYFKLAAKKPGAPPQIIRRYAHALYMGDSLQESYEMWFSIYKNHNSEFEKNAAYNHLLMIK